MKLLRVDFDHVDGLPSGLHVDQLSPGLNIILGGNGSGKSSFVSVARRSLWPAKGSRTFHVRSHWLIHDKPAQASVMNNRVNWGGTDESSHPTVPGEHLSACFVLGIRDLLSEANETDEELASHIRRAMRGGFDLGAVRKQFKVSDHGVRTARKDLRTASTKVAELRRKFRELARDEDHLAELEKRFHEARDADLKLSLLDIADRLIVHRDQLQDVSTELGAAPSELSSLRGGEAENVAQLRELLREHEELHSELTRELAEVQDKTAAIDLPGTGIDSEAIAKQSLDAQQLSRSEAELANLIADLAAAKRQAEKDQDLLLSADGSSRAPLSLDELNELDDYLSSSLGNSSELRAVRRLVEQFSGTEDSQDVRTLTTAEHALSAWLKTPDGRHRSAAPQWLRWFAFASMAAGLLAAALLSPVFLALTTLGVGLFVAQHLTDRSTGGSNTSADEARAAFDLTGLAGPSSWTPEAVIERVSEIRDHLSRAHLEALDKQRLTELSPRLDELLKEHEEIEERGDVLRSATGLPLTSRPMARVEAAHRMARHHRSQASLSELSDRISAHQERVHQGLVVISRFLEEHGIEVPIEANPSTLSAKLAALSERNHELTRLRDAEHRLSADIERYDGVIETTKAKITTIFSTLGLKEDDAAGFAELLSKVEGYQALRAKSSELEAAIVRCERDLVSEPGWLTIDREELASERTRLEDLKASFADRNDQWQTVKGDLRRAREGHQLEDLRARECALEERLFDLHEDALVGEAAGFLLDEVEQSYERSSRPVVLQRAIELFADFTQARYQVEVSSDEQPRLIALDSASKKALELGDLSDGTRIQLLLAVRLAFAMEHSQGRTLPIFLDEALSTTDPVRFRAIASSLLAMVARDQQVFYLTANPADVTGWRQLCSDLGFDQPKVVALDDLRAETGVIKDPERLRTSDVQVPPPGDLSAAQYGALLHPLAPNCFEPPGTLDLYFPLNDRLDLLYVLRSQGIQNIGQWNQLSMSPALGRYLSNEVDQGAVSARVKMAHVFIGQWRLGRGRPMTRADLEQSGAVSKSFIDQLAQCLKSSGGNAQELLDAIASPQIKGFRRAAASKLEAFMLEHNFLDPREALAPLDLELAAVSDLSLELADDRLTTDTIRQFIGLMNRATSTPPSQST